MTDDTSAPATDATEPNDYDEMLATLDTAIAEAREKVSSGRVYDAENERVRIKWIRALAYAVNVRRQVTNDRDLVELTERIEQLEERQDAPDADEREPMTIDFDGPDT